MKKCAEVYRHICDNLDQAVDSPQCREIRKHLDACPDCRAYLNSLKQTVSLYRSLPTPRLPKAAHARLLKIVRLGSASVARPKKVAQRPLRHRR